MTLLKRYRLALDLWGICLFFLVMLPNLIWFAVPAPHDILRETSNTALLDAAASVCQVLFVAALCLLKNRTCGPLRLTPLLLAALCCLLTYWAGWGIYYMGFTGLPVLLMLTLPPCLAFLSFAIDRKNFVAAVPAAMFTLCHLIHGIAYLGD